MLVTFKPISSDLLALESQMFPDCLYVHQHQESSSCLLVALCPCCPSRDCSANSPSWPRSPRQTSEFTLDPSLLCMHACSLASAVSDSLQPQGLQPARILCPWDSPGENTGMGCHALLQEIFPTSGIKLIYPLSPALASRLFTTEPLWKFSSSLDHKYSLSVNMYQEPC